MWYYPQFVDLPGRTQATTSFLEENNCVTATPLQIRQQLRMEPLRIVYEGNAEPIEQQWTPGPALK